MAAIDKLRTNNYEEYNEFRIWCIKNKPSISKVTEKPVWISDGFIGFIFNDIFPEVTFEKSPQEVELKLVNKINELIH